MNTKQINRVYEFLTYGADGFHKTQQRWFHFQFLMNIKRKTGHHLLASDGEPLIKKFFPKEFVKYEQI